jgi:hypothetical protein
VAARFSAVTAPTAPAIGATSRLKSSTGEIARSAGTLAEVANRLRGQIGQFKR